jgi:hypothetical protein
MAKQRGRTADTWDLNRIREACASLRNIRATLHSAGAHRAADYVQRALKSAEGAERHARSMLDREIRRAPCLQFMGCLCAGHARGNPSDQPCDTRE